MGITRSIVAYKSIYLVRLLIKQGAAVKVVKTPYANDILKYLGEHKSNKQFLAGFALETESEI